MNKYRTLSFCKFFSKFIYFLFMLYYSSHPLPRPTLANPALYTFLRLCITLPWDFQSQQDKAHPLPMGSVKAVGYREGNPIGIEIEQPPFWLLGNPHEDQTAHLQQMYKGHRSSPRGRTLLSCGPSLREPGHRWGDSGGLLVGSSTPPTCPLLSSIFPEDSPRSDWYLTVGLFICLHLLLLQLSFNF